MPTPPHVLKSLPSRPEAGKAPIRRSSWRLVLVLARDRRLLLWMSLPHTQHFQEGSPEESRPMVLFAVRAVAEPAGRLPKSAFAGETGKRKCVRLLVFRDLWKRASPLSWLVVV